MSTLPEVIVTASLYDGVENDISADSTKLTTPDSYYLEGVFLMTPVQKISLSSMMTELSYYEDIMRGSTTGNVVLTDSLGIFKDCNTSGLCLFIGISQFNILGICSSGISTLYILP